MTKENNTPIAEINSFETEHELIIQRKTKLAQWREVGTAFPNDFKRGIYAQTLHDDYDEKTNEELEKIPTQFKVAGRMMLQRIMGKASFITLQDMTGRIQLYVRKDNLPEGVYEQFKHWDLGDIIGAEGTLFKTKTGELSIIANHIRLLTKSLQPLPEKHKGLTDQELRYRQRYVDLIVNEQTRETFKIRSKLVHNIRQYFMENDFIEVETPMMQTIAGGAAAKPFITHHNALGIDLYLRIAPELYLKRLVVGGFEKVFEINRNFRNEGLSTKHNPEFTMLEFYQAYCTYTDMMSMTEDLIKYLANAVLHSTKLNYQGVEIDFSHPFKRLTLTEAILEYNPNLNLDAINDFEQMKTFAKSLNIAVQESWGIGKLQLEVFEKTVEEKLTQPTFITQYPTEVSPLARLNDEDPTVTDRFEFFIMGMEIANGFSELNDPEDQKARFLQQVEEKAAGDEEAMPYDADYIQALEYGLPPTAGEGIGIDRLVMLFTDSTSIKDVLLFPHMRPLENAGEQ